MTEPMTTAPDVAAHYFTVAQTMYQTHDPDRVARYRSKMDDLRARFPNQWVVYTDAPDHPDALRWQVNGPFPDEATAVVWGMSLPPEDRSLWTVLFVDTVEDGSERVNHPASVDVV